MDDRKSLHFSGSRCRKIPAAVDILHIWNRFETVRTAEKSILGWIRQPGHLRNPRTNLRPLSTPVHRARFPRPQNNPRTHLADSLSGQLVIVIPVR